MEIITPGEKLSGQFTRGGAGTYAVEGEGLFASVVGRVVVNTKDNSVEVVSDRKSQNELIPYVGGVITGRITRVSTKICDVQILCVGDTPLQGQGFKGTLRKENVRAFEVDQIDLYDCFRQGDLIKASVIALGTSRSYELSTAENHLGVIHAICGGSGLPMVPIGWSEMQCTVSGLKEKRKVAKITE